MCGLTIAEAKEILAAHLAYEAEGGDRRNEWYANISADDMHLYGSDPEDLGDLRFP